MNVTSHHRTKPATALGGVGCQPGVDGSHPVGRPSAAAAIGAQVLSSISNLLLTLAVARVASADQFGRFALLYAGYGLALGVVRTSLLERLLIEHHDDSDTAAASDLVRTVLKLGIAIAVLLLTIAVAVGYQMIAFAAAVAISLPFVLLNDLARYRAISIGTTTEALKSDAYWVGSAIAGFVGAIAVSLSAGHDDMSTIVGVSIVAAWTAGAVVGTAGNAEGRRLLRIVRQYPRAAAAQPVRPSLPLGADHALTSARNVLVLAVVTATFGPDGAAAVGMGQLLFRPLVSLLHGSRLIYLRSFGSHDGPNARPGRTIGRTVTTVVAVSGVAAAAWAIGVASVPAETGARLVGPSYLPFAAQLWPLICFEAVRLIEIPVVDQFRVPTRRRLLPVVRITSLLFTATVAVLVLDSRIADLGKAMIAWSLAAAAALVGAAVLLAVIRPTDRPQG